MQLITLSHKDVKYTINDDGTIVLRIKDEYLLKISWGEIRSLDMIISEQQSEAAGIAREMIERLKKGLDTRKETVEKSEDEEAAPEDSLFDSSQKSRFIRFLESYLSEDEPIEVFDAEDIKTVLGQDFLLSELEDEFGNDYAFKELDNDQISVALLTTILSPQE